MKKIIFLTLLSSLVFSSCKNQKLENYDTLIAEARALYVSGAYQPSGKTYSEAFEVLQENDSVAHRYEAARAWALANDQEKAFKQLSLISDKGDYSNLWQIATDSAFYSLRTDERFIDILKKTRKNGLKAEAHFAEVASLLETVHYDDQKYRQEAEEIQEKYGHDSEEIKAHWEIIKKQDSINLIKVKEILDKQGWLGWDDIGRRANAALFLVIQHADLETQEKYLPMLRKAVKEGDASPADLALLEDRVALRQGKKQIYGSQIGMDQETGEYYVSPLLDPENVNRRRAEVGLGPIEDYISNWNLTWDAEAYKMIQNSTSRIQD